MLAAAARIARGVEVPVTVDAEAGYGMAPAELVAALRSAGAAGCNLEDTDHTAGSLRDPDRHAEWLGRFARPRRRTATGLVINARVDVFLGPFLAGAGPGTQEELVPEALRRAHAYLEAGVDCVYPITLWEARRAAPVHLEGGGPVNVVRLPQAPSLAEHSALGVARVSWGHLLYRGAMARFEEQLASLQECDHLAIVDFDDAVHRRANGDPGERAGDLRSAAMRFHRLEDLRGTDDRVRDRGDLDQLLLRELRAEVTASVRRSVPTTESAT
jgi:2-methylisocitrate lyase-like PEP mutase family enzyme